MNKLSSLLQANIPKYEVTIPSTNKKTTFRPFLVKEEKVLLLAQESEDNSNMLVAIKNIIESCVDKIDSAGSLPLFDIEYLFLQIRAKSVGESIEPTIICPFTGENISITVLIPEIEITKSKKHTKKIKISNDIVLTMNYPSLDILSNRDKMLDYENPSSFYDVVIDCISSIQTKEEIIDVNTLEKEEISDFVDNMSKDQFEKIIDFFFTSPRVEHKVSYTTSDDVEREVVLSGLSDFFG